MLTAPRCCSPNPRNSGKAVSQGKHTYVQMARSVCCCMEGFVYREAASRLDICTTFVISVMCKCFRLLLLLLLLLLSQKSNLGNVCPVDSKCTP